MKTTTKRLIKSIAIVLVVITTYVILTILHNLIHTLVSPENRNMVGNLTLIFYLLIGSIYYIYNILND